MDLTGLFNPRRVLKRREDESDDEFLKRKKEAEEALRAMTPLEEGPRFGKQFTQAERKAQEAKLAAVLKSRK